MNSARRELIRFAKAPRVTVVQDRRSKPGTSFYIAVGVACALGAFIIIGTAILFLRETRHAEAATVKAAVAPAVAGGPTVAADPEPAATTFPSATPVVIAPASSRLAPPSPPLLKQARPSHRPVTAKVFQGTIWPPQDRVEEPKHSVPPQSAVVEEPAPAVAPEAAADTDKDADADRTAAVANESPAMNKNSPNVVKRVFGALARPFRGRPTAKAAATNQ